MQQDLEQRLISVIKDEKILSDIISRGVTSDEFIIHTEEFSFIQQYFNKYNSIPSMAVIESTYPGFKYLDDVKDIEIKYLCDELFKSSARRKAIAYINTSAELLSLDTYGAIDSLVTKLTNIRKQTTNSKSYADGDALRRYDIAVKNRDNITKGVTNGIKTGIKIFDDNNIGWQPGNLIGIIGRLGVGKSTVAQYLGCTAYKAGKRVLFISPEMSAEEVNLKFDTFMGKMNGYTFLNDKLQIGDIDLRNYKKWLEGISTRKDWLTIDSANGKKFNINNINGYVTEFAPDMVIVDGVPLLDGVGEQSWVKMMDVSYGLKAIAQNNKVVVIATSQANRAVGDEMPRPDQVSFGDAFMQAADFGIFMQQNINKPLSRYITIPKRRTGKAINTPIEITFNINEGIISM